jgi:hypothetical protein
MYEHSPEPATVVWRYINMQAYGDASLVIIYIRLKKHTTSFMPFSRGALENIKEAASYVSVKGMGFEEIT